MSKIRRILVPTDFSADSAIALELAIELVSALNARLLVMHVWDPPPGSATETVLHIDGDMEERLSLRDHVRKMAEKRFGDFLSELEVRGLRGVDPRLVEGDPEERIVEASSGVDLVVMGSHGRGALGRLFLGSVAERVSRHAHCPVLIARATGARP